MKSDKEIKEIIAKGNKYVKAAESEIIDMKVRLQKYSGDKEPFQKKIDVFENLMNFAVKCIVDTEENNKKLCNAYFIAAEAKDRVKSQELRIKMLEMYDDLGVDTVTQDVLKSVMIKVGKKKNTTPFMWLIDTVVRQEKENLVAVDKAIN